MIRDQKASSRAAKKKHDADDNDCDNKQSKDNFLNTEEILYATLENFMYPLLMIVQRLEQIRAMHVFLCDQTCDHCQLTKSQKLNLVMSVYLREGKYHDRYLLV